MPAFGVRALTFSLPRFSTHVYSYFINVRFFNSQIAFSKTHHTEFTYNEHRLLNFLSQGELRDANNLLNKMPERSPLRRVVYWTSLLTKYSRSGFVDETRALFDIMPQRNVVTYNVMLSGLLRSGRLIEARMLFEEMPERNVVSWTSMLYGLADAGRICEARRLFDEMPERNVVSWNAMIVGLIKNGDLEDARLVFDEMPVKNEVSWNTMISGYAENGRMEEARALFDEMELRNAITWTSMVAGYCRAGEVEEGYCLFQRTPKRNIVCWTAMIGGFAWNGFFQDALLLFLEMKNSSAIIPNAETFISLVYACAGIGFLSLGKQLHAQVIINELEHGDFDGRLSKSLIYMYSSLGLMETALYILDRNSFSHAIQSYNCIINGYVCIGELEKAQSLFDVAPCRDKITWTSMVDGYFSVGNVSKACRMFHNMPEKDAIAWTTVISGHVQNELFAEAMSLFLEMQARRVAPLSNTYAILFGAAGATACLHQGLQLHGMVMKTLYNRDLILDNSLISMYAKCGVINDAYRVFSDMNTHDLISWNSMIMGFSHHGLANVALKFFRIMGFSPNSITFLGVLSACANVGLINQGWEVFNEMKDVYAIEPGLEHYICMIHLLGRAGKVKEAEEFILGLPVERNHAIWGALLGMCGYGEKNAEIGERAAARLLELDPGNAAGHVSMCNLYAANGEHRKEQKLRKEMGLKGVRKVPGCSWIDINGRAIVFLSGDKLEPQANEMLSFLFRFGDGS
ncbi:pentatricopeptide repeat-containing protein At1g32415, mitochondrial [Euphorbia lathyris]|uniref:pentatricopeptide repeat-containing protein At1g32415, mitochondrial n=1 Tax=Euphorbia lathyris TaxID=212925 RepID=UPI003313C08F